MNKDAKIFDEVAKNAEAERERIKSEGIGAPTGNYQSPTTGKLYEALSKAQGEITGAAKSANNPFFNSSYADLASVWDACREALNKHGLCIIQMPESGEGGYINIRTRLGHSSGEYVESVLAVKNTKGDAHGMGSAITYGRRYMLSAFIGIPQIDDDGNTATQSSFKSKQMKTKVWKNLKDAAAEDDALKASETWRELSQAEQIEIWHELSSGQHKKLKELLAETKEEAA